MSTETRTVSITTAPNASDRTSDNTSDDETLTLTELLDTIDAVHGHDVHGHDVRSADGWPSTFYVGEEIEREGVWEVINVLHTINYV
jgi:hypothetical protein